MGMRSQARLKVKAPMYWRSVLDPNETKLTSARSKVARSTPTRAAFQAVGNSASDQRRASLAYFFSGVPAGGVAVEVAGVAVVAAAPAVPGVGNGNVLNIDFAWVCICSCICTNMFFDCSI